MPQELVQKMVGFFPKQLGYLGEIDSNNLSNAVRVVVDRQMNSTKIKHYNQPMMLIAFGLVFFALAIIIILPSVVLSAILFLCIGFTFVGLSIGIMAMEKKPK